MFNIASAYSIINIELQLSSSPGERTKSIPLLLILLFTFSTLFTINTSTLPIIYYYFIKASYIVIE